MYYLKDYEEFNEKIKDAFRYMNQDADHCRDLDDDSNDWGDASVSLKVFSYGSCIRQITNGYFRSIYEVCDKRYIEKGFEVIKSEYVQEHIDILMDEEKIIGNKEKSSALRKTIKEFIAEIEKFVEKNVLKPFKKICLQNELAKEEGENE